jgi:hypothetical protein
MPPNLKEDGTKQWRTSSGDRVRSGLDLGGEVAFDWEKVEGADPPNSREVADRVFSDCLAWLFSFCLAGSDSLKTKGEQAVAFRRFLALAYVYRPDLIGGKTIKEIAGELEVAPQSVNKFIADVSLEFKSSGLNQFSIANRVARRDAQIKKKIAGNKSRVRKRVTSDQ